LPVALVRQGNLQIGDGLAKMEDNELFSAEITINEIVEPHDFCYQLENYIIPPERRIGNKLFNVVSFDNKIVRIGITSLGSVHKPILKLEALSTAPLRENDLKQLKKGINRWLGLSDDLKPFYDLVRDDSIMCAAIEMRYGAKDKANFSFFEALIGTVCAQNSQFKRVYSMMGNLCEHLGSKISINGYTYSAFPSISKCAACSIEELRACKVGYRGNYIKSIAQALEEGQIDLAKIEQMSYQQAKMNLLKLHGIGPYTADLCLILAFRRRDIFYLDSYVREALKQFYFKGKETSDDVLRDFVTERWPDYQAWAIAMLTTDTENLASRMGIPFRFKSGAKEHYEGASQEVVI
jgi:3-methyladenine DNA glycosylase/8-oxoguanine DNA glycosylase